MDELKLSVEMSVVNKSTARSENLMYFFFYFADHCHAAAPLPDCDARKHNGFVGVHLKAAMTADAVMTPNSAAYQILNGLIRPPPPTGHDRNIKTSPLPSALGA